MNPPKFLTGFLFLVALLSTLAEGEEVWPNATWATAAPQEAGLDQDQLLQARDYALTADGSGMIVRHGRLVLSWGDLSKRFDLKSTSKSIGGTVLALAVKDGLVKLDDPATRYHPSFGVPPSDNLATDWLDRITLRHLANQTAGFEKPGGFRKLLFAPGAKWHYSDGGPNWLAECLTLVYRRDLNEVLSERVWSRLGIGIQDIQWRDNAYRPHEIDGYKRREFGSGFSANVNAMARIGLLYLRGGRWRNEQLLPVDYVSLVGQTAPENTGLPEHSEMSKVNEYGNASDHYSLLWWNNGDGTIPDLPRDTYWSWGLYDSLIVVMPSLDIVAARAGRSWARGRGAHYDALKPFLQPIANAAAALKAVRQDRVGAAPATLKAPYPPSTVIRNVTWAPRGSIIRMAKGGDNWPVTWADDDALYTAYGDGWGFAPFVPNKLSMGLAKITGSPPDILGVNLRSPTIEAPGDGSSGPKSSGLLMVDGVLYLLARNLGNARLAWSKDHGNSWTWVNWTFTTSFGCPTFLNYGRNYAGARDDYVYLYSPDQNDAYHPADGLMLARVPKARLTQRDGYEYFRQLDASGGALWTQEISNRGLVFSNPGRCYRSSVSYHASSGRYLLCQILPESRHPQGPRFQGGFGIYDAPEPWGPWTTVFFSNAWDVGPGETASLPTKWMSSDGTSVHLVFSGNDCFSVRQARWSLADP